MYTNKHIKLLAAACALAVICATFSGVVALAILLCVAFPMALYCRKRMDTEAQDVERQLRVQEASCTLRCSCFEGIDPLTKGEECVIYFVRKGLDIHFEGSKRLLIPISQIKHLHRYSLPEILEIAQSERRFTLGKLGDAMSFNQPNQSSHRIAQQNKVSYMIVETIDNHANSGYLSFFAPAECYGYNKLGTRGKTPEQYLLEAKQAREGV